MVSAAMFAAFAFFGTAFAGHLPLEVGRNVGTKGCGMPHKVDGVSRNFSISTDGVNRTYRLHLPSSYDPNTPAPLVLSFHGHGKNMVEQETLSQFSNDAINPSMIAVYPQGLKAAVSRALFSFPSNASYLY